MPTPKARPRSLGDFRGKAVAVVFGYTRCPDVCPTTLADYAKAVKLLGPEGDRVQVLFVTLDPERDSAALLRSYVPAFDPAFLGLRGDAEATARVVRDFKLYVEKGPADASGNYAVQHSSQVFVYDPAGKLRLIVPAGTSPPAIAADLRRLLAS